MECFKLHIDNEPTVKCGLLKKDSKAIKNECYLLSFLDCNNLFVLYFLQLFQSFFNFHILHAL